jgi:hypothetical protein
VTLRKYADKLIKSKETHDNKLRQARKKVSDKVVSSLLQDLVYRAF